MTSMVGWHVIASTYTLPAVHGRRGNMREEQPMAYVTIYRPGPKVRGKKPCDVMVLMGSPIDGAGWDVMREVFRAAGAQIEESERGPG
jgi:hypothetical protein